MKYVYYSLEYSAWQSKHFTSLTPFLSLMKPSLGLGSGSEDIGEISMDLWALYKIWVI